ncbi:hypothetical protein AAMO2058_000449600 [Amorphochlora amoebiformis]
MARPGFAFLLCAVVAIACILGFRASSNLGAPAMRTSSMSRSVRVNSMKYPKSALGSWGDAISKNALADGKGPKAPITKKAWWNCLDPKWKTGGVAAAAPSTSSAKE